MTEEVKQNGAIIKREPIDVGERGLTLRTMDEMYRFSQYALASNLAPSSFKSPESIMIAIQYGFEIGLTPMKALQSIAVVNGRPTIWGDASLALVLCSPLCEYFKENLTGTGDKMIATCESKRKGSPEPCVTTFSVEDAKKGGLWGKAGPWSQYPQRMLKYRARGFNLRDTFPDVLGGLHLQEEFDYDDKPVDQTTPGVSGLKKRIAAKKTEGQVATPVHEQEAEFVQPAEAAADANTEEAFSPENDDIPGLPTEPMPTAPEQDYWKECMDFLLDLAGKGLIVEKNAAGDKIIRDSKKAKGQPQAAADYSSKVFIGVPAKEALDEMKALYAAYKI